MVEQNIQEHMEQNEEKTQWQSPSIDGLSEKEAEQFYEIMKRFLNAYKNREQSATDYVWLGKQLKEELPAKSQKECDKMAEEILVSVTDFDNCKKELEESCEKGVPKEQWLANKLSDAAAGTSVVQFGNYLNGIDNAITNANAQMMRTIMTKEGNISQCINLDGFIAEQHAVNTFNMQAQLEGSKFRAEVKVPGPGETYGKNSFDTVIMDTASGKIVHQYQFKFGKTAKETIQLLKNGNYNNQRFVVPAEQVAEVQKAFPGKTVTSCMGGTETVSIESKMLTKADVKEMQYELQEGGVLPQNNWNTYTTKDLALNIGKNAGLMGLQSALITTGFDLTQKVIKGEEIQGDEMLEQALISGADAGVKAASAGALKVGVEKGVIKIIPPGTPAHIIVNIACVGIENIKILAKVASGEIKMYQAADQMARATTSMVAGLACAGNMAFIGAVSLSWIPIVGPIAGGLIGGMVGYMAGSTLGNAVYSGLKKVGGTVRTAAKSAWNGIKSAGRKIANGARNLVNKILG